MVRRTIAAGLLVLVAFTTVGCEASTTADDSDAPGGPGMTYNGKLGYDFGNGFVQPLDGSAPGLGFGF